MNDKGPAIILVVLILGVLGILGTVGYLYVTSEVLIENGTVTSKCYVPSRTDTHLETYTDGDGNTHMRTVTHHHPEEFNVTIMGGRHTFRVNDFNVFNRFREGAKVRVAYLSKLPSWVKRVYSEDEKIPVEAE